MSNLYNVGGGSPPSAAPNTRPAQANGQSLPAGGETLPPSKAPTADLATAAEISESIDKAVSQLSEIAGTFQRSLAFSVNRDTGDTVIVVTDSETEEVVRQIPSEFSLQLAQNLNQLRESLEIGGEQALGEAIDLLGSKGNLFDISV